MTASDRAKFRRIDQRRDRLYKALCVIYTWLSFPDDPKDILYRIGKHVTECIEDEQTAERKEEMRELKGGVS